MAFSSTSLLTYKILYSQSLSHTVRLSMPLCVSDRDPLAAGQAPIYKPSTLTAHGNLRAMALFCLPLHSQQWACCLAENILKFIWRREKTRKGWTWGRKVLAGGRKRSKRLDSGSENGYVTLCHLQAIRPSSSSGRLLGWLTILWVLVNCEF